MNNKFNSDNTLIFSQEQVNENYLSLDNYQNPYYEYQLNNEQYVDYTNYIPNSNDYENNNQSNYGEYLNSDYQYANQEYDQLDSNRYIISYPDYSDYNNNQKEGFFDYSLDYQNYDYANFDYLAIQKSDTLENNIQLKVKSNSDKDNSRWIFPKNFKKLSAEEYNKLTPKKKKEYENFKNSARKIGYVLEKKSLIKFYRVSLIDFFPLFIGLFVSFIRFIIGYSDIIHSINFDKKTIWDFRSNFIIGMIFSLVIWPILVLCFLVIYPYIVLDSSQVTYAWNHLIDQLNVNGISSLGTGLQAYFNGAIDPLFKGDILIITIIIFVLASMVNVQTFLFSGLLNLNRKIVFRIHRETVRDEIEKIRIQKINKNKQ